MIKYLTAFILFASPCLAGMGIGGFPYPGPGSLQQSGITAFCPGSDIFVRGTGSSGYTESYEKGVNDFCSSDWVISNFEGVDTYSPEVYLFGTHALKFSASSTFAAGGPTLADHGSFQTAQYYRLYFYLPEGFTKSGEVGTIGGVGKYNTTSNGTIRFSYLSGTSFLLGSSLTTETITVSSGGWYRMEVAATDADGSGVGYVTYAIRVFDQTGTSLETSNGSGDYDLIYTTTTDAFRYLHLLWTFTGATTKSIFIDGVKNCDTWCGAEL